MKAAINGTLNLSTLDADDTRQIDAEDFYTQLQYQVIPEFYYRDHVRWMRRMKRTIGLAGYFNTHRCIDEYMKKAWTGAGDR